MSVKDNTYGIAPLQDKMLDILKHFIDVCETNGFQYFLAGGTCIGALRHQGFIPWDDDLDVIMPRSDYEKLWELLKDKSDGKYQLCRTTQEKNYHHRVMQMVDLSTTFIHDRCKNEDIEHGVYIDILPLDAYPQKKRSRLWQKLNAVVFSIYNIQCKPEYNGGKLTGLIKIASSIMLSIIRSKTMRFKIWTKAEKEMSHYTLDKTDKVIVITSTFRDLTTPFPKEWFSDRKIVFEDTEVTIPCEAEKYCTALYGNYEELPPVKDRKVVHNTVLIDLENSYTKYRGQYYCVSSTEKSGVSR